jgi:hypothetical protein
VRDLHFDVSDLRVRGGKFRTGERSLILCVATVAVSPFVVIPNERSEEETLFAVAVSCSVLPFAFAVGHCLSPLPP